MPELIKGILTGGSPRSLGRTEEVVRLVLDDQSRFGELFKTVFDDDEIIRLRAGDAIEKVARERPEWLTEYKKALLEEVAAIRQPSVQWHLAQIFGEIELTAAEQRRATEVLLGNMEQSGDWIVICYTLDTLEKFARTDEHLRKGLLKLSRKYAADPRKTVAKRASKLLARLA